MLHELRIYTFRAGQAPVAAKNSGEKARDIRGDDYGKLEGYWLPEIGPLNQVAHLWSYDDFAHREERRKALSQNKRCLLYTSPSPRDTIRSRMPSSA